MNLKRFVLQIDTDRRNMLTKLGFVLFVVPALCVMALADQTVFLDHSAPRDPNDPFGAYCAPHGSTDATLYGHWWNTSETPGCKYPGTADNHYFMGWQCCGNTVVSNEQCLLGYCQTIYKCTKDTRTRDDYCKGWTGMTGDVMYYSCQPF